MALHLVTGYAGREHVTSADHGSFNIAFVGEGEFVFDRADMFEATIIDETHVRIGSGDILMQGRHIRQMENTQTTLTFDAGVAGLYRKDMVVAEYNKDNTTKIESARFNIIKGTSAESESSAVLPSYTHGDITEENSDLVNQMPLFEVDFSGIDIVDVKPLYTVMQGYDHALDDIKAEARVVIREVKASREIAESYTVAANRWSGTTYSFESDYPVADYDIVNFIPSDVKAMRKAWAKADCGGYNANANAMTAHGKVPTIDISGTIFVRTSDENDI